MKKAMLLFALLLLAAAGFAQTSLLGVEFGASGTGTVDMLKAQGFQESSREEGIVYLNGPSGTDMLELRLYLDEKADSLYKWVLNYDLEKNPELVDTLLAQLEQLHGNASVVDDFGADFIWYFPNNRALYFHDYDNFVALIYEWGNWDDDFYGWYGDDW